MSNISSIAFLIGRVIVAVFFLLNGFNHFAQLNMMTGYAKSKGTTNRALGAYCRNETPRVDSLS
jgi:uncharacterized membrane protein YphA (DoxX/SURF4 family)